MTYITKESALQAISDYTGGAVDKTVAREIIDGLPEVVTADDLISRQAAIKMLFDGFDYVDNESFGYILAKLKTLPSAQPEPCEDAVSREAISEWLKQYGQDVLHGKYKFSLMYIWKNLMDLPSAQPEIIRCKDCKWFRKEYGWNCIEYTVCGISPTYHPIRKEEDYCSRVERREDAEIH